MLKHSYEDFLNKLKNKSIHLSHQRIKILEYLFEKQGHLTADEIFRDLHKEVPTLSKTTVYNTLNLFVDANIVKMITTEENEARYELVSENHGHFKCESCGNIYDFEIDPDILPSSDLDGFVVHEKDIYFRGICPRCVSNIEEVE